MKRILEISTVIIIIFIIIGALITADRKGTLDKKENFFSFIWSDNNEKNEITKEFEITDDNMNFNVDISNSSVEVISTNENKIKVECIYYGNTNFYIDQKQDKIIVKSNKRRNFSLFNWNSKDGQVKIYIPQSVIGEYCLDTSNGFISFSDVKVKGIDGNTSNGLISLKNVEGNGKIKIESSNGGITIDDVISEEVILDSSNGDVKINKVKGEYLEIDTSNGGINAEEVYCKEVNFDTSNGSVYLDNIEDKEYVIDKIKVSTSNGSKDINANYKILKD